MEAWLAVRIIATGEQTSPRQLPMRAGTDDESVATNEKKQFIVGAATDCDLVVVSPQVWEPRHLGFTWHGRHSTWVLENFSQHPVQIGSLELRPGESRPIRSWDESITSCGAELLFHRQPAQPIHAGQRTGHIPLTGRGLIIGRGPQNKDGSDTPRLELDRDLRSISSAQAQVVLRGGDYYLINLNPGNSDRTIVNGDQNFEERKLVLGDCIRIPNCDYYTFKFTGKALRHLGVGGLLKGEHLTVDVSVGRILHDVSLELTKGAFLGIIGGSGQGKSTLMNALCGIVPPTSGRVEVDGKILRSPREVALAGIGYVPQEDIVHRELTVEDALGFSARLRLKAKPAQLHAVVESTMDALRLTEHRKKRISDLSGGQRKRVSIASELLVSPDYLFLDEPTSGLDPQTERLLMGELSELARHRLMGVASTTHVLQNCHVMTEIAFISRGRLIFHGRPADAVRFFLFSGSPEGAGRRRLGFATSDEGEYSEAELLGRISRIYDISQDTTQPRNEQDAVAENWEKEFKALPSARQPLPVQASTNLQAVSKSPVNARVGSLRCLILLLSRQRKLLTSSKLSCLFLAAQALVIGALIGWVSDNVVLQMFLSLIATLWFGCSNGAQQIVGELPIFRRERLSGLGINTYVSSKFIFFTAITALQALGLFGTVLTVDHLLHDKREMDKDKEGIAPDPNGTIPDKRIRDFREAFFDKQWSALARGDDKHNDTGFKSQAPTADSAGSKESADAAFTLVGLEVDDKNRALPPEAWTVHINPSGLRAKDAEYRALEHLAWFFGIRESVLRLLAVHSVKVASESEQRLVELRNGSLSWKIIILNLVGLRLVALFAAALVGVALGLAVSALVNTPTQAVMWVPLILIPQILFGSFVVVVPEMDESVLAFSRGLPSFNLQRIMDVALIYGRPAPRVTNQTKIPAFLSNPPDNDEKVEWDGRETTYDRISGVNKSWQNLTVLRDRIGKREKETVTGHSDLPYSSVEYRPDVRIQSGVDAVKGIPYLTLSPAFTSAYILLAWAITCYTLAALALLRRQTGR